MRESELKSASEERLHMSDVQTTADSTVHTQNRV
jgi:hypothetical protein